MSSTLERCSASPVIREVQMEATVRSPLLGWLFRTTEQDSSAGEDVEKQEASCVASGSMKGLGCCGYRHGSAPQTEHELPPCTI